MRADISKIILSLSLILSLLPTVVFAQFSTKVTTAPAFAADGSHLGDFQVNDQAFNIFQLIFGKDIPANVLNSNDVLQKLVFPFVAIWMIMYGILSEIRIFTRKAWIQTVIALMIALVSSVSGALWGVVFYTFYAGGWLGTIIFGGLLIVGIFLWAATRLWGWGIRGRGSGGWSGLMGRSSLSLDLDKQVQRYEDEIRRLKYQSEAGLMTKTDAASAIREALGKIDEAEKKKRQLSKAAAEEEKEATGG